MQSNSLINAMKSFVMELIIYINNHIISGVPFHYIRKIYYRKIMGVYIGEDSYIFLGAYMDTRSNLVIGKNSVINQNCRLDNRGSLCIGSNVSISSEVQILTADHDPSTNDLSSRLRGVVICDYVFVGTRAMILPGVRLGKGSYVAAGAIVTRDVQDYCVVAGVPARVIGIRGEEFNYEVDYGRLFH